MIAACSDPPAPPPLSDPARTVAVYVEWRAPDAAVRAPVVVFVDVAGGPVDRLAADSDVTTFLNDRFHPVLLPAYAAQPVGTVAFYDGEGCLLAGPARPADPQALIDLANGVVLDPRSRGITAPRLPERCPRDR